MVFKCFSVAQCFPILSRPPYVMLTSQWQIAESKSVAKHRHSYTLNVAVLNFKLLLVFSMLLAFCSVLHNSVSAICLHSNRRMGRTNASGYNNETLFQHCADAYKSRHAVFAIYLRSCERHKLHETLLSVPFSMVWFRSLPKNAEC